PQPSEQLQLRREHSSFRRRRWFQGQAASSARQLPDIAWFKPDGEMMNEQDWHSRSSRSVGVFLNGDDISSLDSRGHPEQDKSFLVIFNANGERLNFTLPGVNFGIRWLRILDTAALLPCSYLAEEAIAVEGHSVCLLQRVE
ncbi:MAG: glycogen debranching enzyme, partial [Candidatus Dormibacteraceae bacterium]